MGAGGPVCFGTFRGPSGKNGRAIRPLPRDARCVRSRMRSALVHPQMAISSTIARLTAISCNEVERPPEIREAVPYLVTQAVLS
jgi:DNA polymerase III epsilon subunit-like protein